MYFLSSLVAWAALFHLTLASYVLEDDYMKDFYGNFDFFTADDPTSGFVEYVDQSTAQEMGLIKSNTTGPASWGVDSINETPQGRPSIRLTSKKSYNSGLVILDVEHMPVGCGTWPAFWMVGPKWPKNGEIDILEGVNEQEHNAMTLHTGPGCAISTSEDSFLGSVETDNCDIRAPDQNQNAGCSIKHPSKKSFGTGLNSNKGGVYATQWTDSAISVFFFPRDEIPENVLGDSPDPSTWGIPAAKFAGACDIASVFKQQQIIFTTTFCGDWAGNEWEGGSCADKAPTCDEYVQSNPEAFADAYWTINSLKVYQESRQGDADSPTTTSQPGLSSSSVLVSSAVSSETGVETSTQTIIETVIVTPTVTQTPIFTSSDSSPPFPVPTSNTTIALGPTAPLPTSNTVLPTAPLATTGNSILPTSIPPSAGNSTTLPPPLPSGSVTLAPVPTGGVGGAIKPVFQWPGAGGNGSNDTDNASSPPAQSSASTAVSSPSSSASDSTAISTAVLEPSTTIPASPSSSNTDTEQLPTTTEELGIPIPTGGAGVSTVYVTADPATATDGPGRRARFAREHRRRITRHHARR